MLYAASDWWAGIVSGCEIVAGCEMGTSCGARAGVGRDGVEAGEQGHLDRRRQRQRLGRGGGGHHRQPASDGRLPPRPVTVIVVRVTRAELALTLGVGQGWRGFHHTLLSIGPRG